MKFSFPYIVTIQAARVRSIVAGRADCLFRSKKEIVINYIHQIVQTIYSVLGLHTRQRTTSVEISAAVKEKIADQIKAHKINTLPSRMPARSGRLESESQFKLCYNPTHPEYYFVISEKIHFGAYDIVDTSYGVYAFNLEGAAVDFENRYTKGSFFRNRFIFCDL